MHTLALVTGRNRRFDACKLIPGGDVAAQALDALGRRSKRQCQCSTILSFHVIGRIRGGRKRSAHNPIRVVLTATRERCRMVGACEPCSRKGVCPRLPYAELIFHPAAWDNSESTPILQQPWSLRTPCVRNVLASISRRLRLGTWQMLSSRPTGRFHQAKAQAFVRIQIAHRPPRRGARERNSTGPCSAHHDWY